MCCIVSKDNMCARGQQVTERMGEKFSFCLSQNTWREVLSPLWGEKGCMWLDTTAHRQGAEERRSLVFLPS